MFGAERLLMNRAAGEAVFRDVVALVNDFKRYLLRHKRPIYENPSPGNVAGGLTTLEEKSLGAIQKGGRAPVTQVLRYGEPAATRREGWRCSRRPETTACRRPPSSQAARRCSCSRRAAVRRPG